MYKKIFRGIFSRPYTQFFFECVLKVSLKALNIGEGQSVETSGESYVFKMLYKRNANPIVFDVGAHVGEWFNLFNKNFKGKSEVYSFEPSKAAFANLATIKANGFHAENIALGNKNETLFLKSEVIGDSTAQISRSGTEEVRSMTLDSFCYDRGIKNIGLLKLDVEGYELKILEGSKKMMDSGGIDMIQFEFGAPSEEKYTMKDFFDVLGNKYDIYRILRNGVYRLKKYSHTYEILTVSNFIAVLK